MADPGFDAGRNHRIARLDLNVRSVVPPPVGQSTKDGRPPDGRFRRLMHHRVKRKADERAYGRRWHSKTVNNHDWPFMVEQNLGLALRARTEERRAREMLLRTLTHNVTLA